MSVSTLKKGSKGPMVKTLKESLNAALLLSPGLDAKDALFDDSTAKAVVQFKQRRGLKPAVGEVDGVTWGALGQELGMRTWMFKEPLPQALKNLFRCLFQGPMNFRQDLFFGLYMKEYGGLNDKQRDGLSELLKNIDLDPHITDVRWAAYMLATVKHECADTWQPIEEYGKGKSHEYGKEVSYKAKDGKVYKNKYYGRGFVQLTWKKNYEKLGTALGLGEELAISPAKALDPVIAYKILSYGMREGSFTGKKLADYIHGNVCDYKRARRIINGNDKATLIQGHALKLETMLRASLIKPAQTLVA